MLNTLIIKIVQLKKSLNSINIVFTILKRVTVIKRKLEVLGYLHIILIRCAKIIAYIFCSCSEKITCFLKQ